jgi:isopenicillin-N epimerase
MKPVDWGAARAQMLLDPTVTNLNTGSFGPQPRIVFDHVTELRRRLGQEPMDFLVRQMPPLLWGARERLARFIGADPYRLIFTANVSAGINIIAACLRPAGPGEIVTTDHEYLAMHWCWERAAVRLGLDYRVIPLPARADDPSEIVGAFRAALRPETRLLFFSHVLSPTGAVLPAKEICAEAHRRGVLTVVDGAHAPGMVSLDVSDVGCDFYAGNCHKWLLAPIGSGFLYLGRGNEDRLQPLQVSWGWHYDRTRPDERDEFGSTPRIRALEFEGTRDPCAWLAAPAAIEFQEELGWTAIRTRMTELVRHVRRRIGALGLESVTPTNPSLHGAMTAFRLPPAADTNRLRREIWEKHRIEVPIIERPGEVLVRVSTHFYNTEDEIDQLARALRELI